MDAPRGDLRLQQGARGAQHDQVLEGEAVLAPRPALGADETGADQAAGGGRRELQDPLDVPHAVGTHFGSRAR